MPRKKTTTDKNDWEYRVPVKFGTVGIGKQVARIGVKVADVDLDDEQANELFRNSELQAELVCDPNAKEDAKGQEKMAGMDKALPCVARATGFRTNCDGHSTSLQITKSSIDVSMLADFAAMEGTLNCKVVGPAEPVNVE